MKVLMLQDTCNYAGTEAHILTLSDALSKVDGVDIELLAPVGSELEKRSQTMVHYCHVCRRSFIAFFFSTIALVRTVRPDIIHAHNGRMTLIAVLAAKLLGCKVVASQHFLEPAHVSSTGLSGKVKRALHQWVGRQLDFRICVSQAALTSMQKRRDIIAKTESAYSVIHNGIDISKVRRSVTKTSLEVRSELGIRSSSKLITCAARLEPEKNIEVLLDAFKIATDAGIDAHLVIAGDGSLRVPLEQRIIDRDLSHLVNLVGFRPDVHSIMQASDAFVLPAANEPFGLVLLEAMCLGTPSLAAQSGGPLEIIEDGLNGYLFMPNDAVNLAEHIVRVLTEPVQTRIVSDLGQESVLKKFSSSVMASATIRAYAATLGLGH
jgi:glycosyltransferase involved in cell wall biosynthesis